MKKLAVLALLLLIVPSAFALLLETHDVKMTSTFIAQGYEYAIVQGFNRNDRPVNIEHWHMKVELGQTYAFCEIQPTVVQPGPFMADVEVSCMTRSGLTSFVKKDTIVKISKYVPDDTPANTVTLDTIKIETRPQAPIPFQVTKVTGEATLSQSASTTGSLMFLLGIGVIVIVAIAVILASLRQE
jgi:hypothetical protein